MKKYTSRATKRLAIVTLISAVILATGIVFTISDYHNIGLQIGLTAVGGIMSILLFSCFLAEKGRYLIIDADKIVLPRGADKNGKLSFQRTVVKISEISAVENNMHKGDGIISKDTCFYTLKLKDGTAIQFTLFAYGRAAEEEIIESVKKHI